MDAYLKLLADAGLALTAAEEAAGAGELGAADEAVDRADHALDRLRAEWAAMTGLERALVGRAAAPLRARLDALQTSLPKRSALSEGAPERDPDEDVDPARAA